MSATVLWLAWVASATLPPPARAQAQAAPKAYDIPAGPLDDALNRFARSTGVLLSFDPVLADGKRSPGLNGTYAVPDGFKALLEGTGLQATALADGSYAVTVGPASAAGGPAAATPALLPEVKVQAGRDVPITEGTGRYAVRASDTATRLTLSPRETPQSISVVTRTQMDDFGLSSVNSVLANTTGVNVDAVETDRSYFTARGFDISNFQVDGVGMPFTNGDQLGDIDTAAFDRVEVLRGANGLLSSTGNPAATINHVRKRPTADFRAAGGVTLGSWNKRRLDGDVSGALNSSRSVRGRVVVAAQRADSFMDNYALDKTLFAGLVEADVGPRSVLAFGTMRQQNRPEGTAWGGLPLNYSNGAATDYPHSTAAAPRWSHWDNTDTTTFVEFSHELANDWRAKAVLSHRTLESDGKLFNISGGLPDAATGLGTESWLSTQIADESQTLLDVHAAGPFELGRRRHELVVGANRSKVSNQASYTRGAGNGSPLAGVSDWGSYPEPVFNGATGSADFVNHRDSAYAVARFNLADPWKVLAGLNVTRMESEGLGFRGVPRVYNETKTVPYLGSVLDLDAHHSLYASYSRIFNPQTQVDANQQLVGPIDGSNVELGAKGEWFDRRLIGSVALFQARQNNTAEFAGFDSVGGFSYFTGVDAKSTGFELDMAGQLAPGWEISADYTQLRLTDRDGRDTRTFVPRRTFRLATSYRVASMPKLKLGATLKWQGDIHRINLTQQTSGGEDIVRRQGAYALLGLMARYDIDKHFSTILTLNNVTDKKYLASLYWDQSLYGAPRNASVSLNWTY